MATPARGASPELTLETRPRDEKIFLRAMTLLTEKLQAAVKALRLAGLPSTIVLDRMKEQEALMEHVANIIRDYAGEWDGADIDLSSIDRSIWMHGCFLVLEELGKKQHAGVMLLGDDRPWFDRTAQVQDLHDRLSGQATLDVVGGR